MEVPNKALYYGPHKSVFHLAGKHFLYMGVCYASFILIFLLPVFSAQGRHLESGLAFRLALRMAVVMGGVMATLSFLVAVVPCEIGRSFFGKDSERSTAQGAAFSLASLAVFPAIAFFTYWGLTGHVEESLHHLLLGLCFAPAAPVVFAMMSRKMLEERRYEEEWAGLPIEG